MLQSATCLSDMAHLLNGYNIRSWTRRDIHSKLRPLGVRRNVFQLDVSDTRRQWPSATRRDGDIRCCWSWWLWQAELSFIHFSDIQNNYFRYPKKTRRYLKMYFVYPKHWHINFRYLIRNSRYQKLLFRMSKITIFWYPK